MKTTQVPLSARAAWIYRGVLGLLFIISIGLAVQLQSVTGAVDDLKQQVVVSRNDRQQYQGDQRELGCQVIVALKATSQFCNADGTPKLPTPKQ